eukprot:CAMPEP_0195305194 /NCGR_PEP_ID=MMETSP0707-20130614/35857_1 /TAXON_ID=33640 /ORGANISM="Asterionellopsis glacialis, Strain CCMP134" /LENGTH=116 /DNA_ID=CAMNT_0040369241 /DNA_START=47 /DNA_END=400 /DNA_ORIENTATION=+
MPNELEMKLGGCCDEPGLCIYTTCCPCFAVMEGANNIDEIGPLYCLLTFCGFGCCAVGVLGEKVGGKRDIPISVGESLLMTCFDCCTCWSCRVIHETRLYKEQGGSAAPTKDKMDR